MAVSSFLVGIIDKVHLFENSFRATSVVFIDMSQDDKDTFIEVIADKETKIDGRIVSAFKGKVYITFVPTQKNKASNIGSAVMAPTLQDVLPQKEETINLLIEVLIGTTAYVKVGL